MMIKRVLATVYCLLMAISSVAAEPVVPSIQVEFKNCVETIGVGLAPTDNVAALVPESYTPVGMGGPVTPIVVRTARCDVNVFGQVLRQKSIVQIGAVIVPPDGSGDINNYTLFYYTDDLRLAALLNLTGVPAQFVPVLSYRISPDNAVNVRVPFPGSPRLSISGNVTPSSQPAGAFVANWWRDRCWGTVKMQTTVPVIKVGTADLQLSTPTGSQLANLTGEPLLTFPIIQQFNTFTTATLATTID